MHFQGNVRDLRSLVKRVLARMPPGRRDITWKDVVDASGSETVAPGDLTPPMPMRAFLDAHEREHLEHAMQWAKGNCTKAANQLEIDRGTVVRLLTKHGMKHWL